MQKRILHLNDQANTQGPVLYWMSRDQRIEDNWALLHAQEEAIHRNQPLLVVFCLVDTFLGATSKHFDFMLVGLAKLQKDLEKYNIPFLILQGQPNEQIPKMIQKVKAGLLITDFSPLKISRQWKNEVAARINISFREVDAHNIVPCFVASPKAEFGAYTIRPKINKVLDEFLHEFPKLSIHPFSLMQDTDIQQLSMYTKSILENYTSHAFWNRSGEEIANRKLHEFITNKLPHYDERNDPNANVTSKLSVYLHFGQISAQRIALQVKQENNPNVSSFLEELIIRKELADNFCYYNPKYDSFEGFPAWAKLTHEEHRADIRNFCYSLESLENASTHDPLWNAAQMEMQKTGYMHGYLRMYWAKKILEWTTTPEQALAIGIYLNDKYQLDGRDPNGYAGVAWSIGGVHDRAWPQRPIFGKIRYMNFDGCKRKFDVNQYIRKVNLL